MAAEICRATLLNFLEAAERDQRCALLAVWPLYNQRRTFPDAHRDCRCNAAPSLRVFSGCPENRIPARRDARRSGEANAIAHLRTAARDLSTLRHFPHSTCARAN